jgi:hypothetical protein
MVHRIIEEVRLVLSGKYGYFEAQVSRRINAMQLAFPDAMRSTRNRQRQSEAFSKRIT